MLREAHRSRLQDIEGPQGGVDQDSQLLRSPPLEPSCSCAYAVKALAMASSKQRFNV